MAKLKLIFGELVEMVSYLDIRDTVKVKLYNQREDIMESAATTNLVNRGTGAGGANTNANGLSFERRTDLNTLFTIQESGRFHQKIQITGNDRVYEIANQGNFFKHMGAEANPTVAKAHGCKKPDEVIIDRVNHKIFIIEKKHQNRSGSVCEKIQSGPFKKQHYQATFPDWEVVYIYTLSSWFFDNMVPTIAYLRREGIPVFLGNSDTYKQELIDFILNYPI